MANARPMPSLPPAVPDLATPEETTPGTCVIKYSFRQRCILIAVRTERRRATGSWHGASSSGLIALRAQNIRDSGRWIAITSKSDSELREKLQSYARLDENWDGDGAKAPLQEAVNDALTFLNGRPGDIPLPYPEEGTEGDVGICWDLRDAKVFAEVTFEGDGTCAYFAVRGEPGAVEEKYGKDDVDVLGRWPDDILRILRSQYPA